MKLTTSLLVKKNGDSSLLWRTGSRLVCSIISAYSKVWIEWFNKTTVYNRSRLYRAEDEKGPRRGLITVTNHVSCMDDPLIWGLRRWSDVFRGTPRWIPTAEEVCFTNPFLSTIFLLGRCVPVVRGAGVYQRCMDICVDLLNQGEWIHIFPEGYVNKENEHVRLKWGVGRLVADSEVTPLVLPIYHVGMDSILPTKKPYIPRVGKQLTVAIGEPLDFTEDVRMLRQLQKTPVEIRKYITDVIQDTLWTLREETEQLHAGTLQDVSDNETQADVPPLSSGPGICDVEDVASGTAVNSGTDTDSSEEDLRVQSKEKAFGS